MVDPPVADPAAKTPGRGPLLAVVAVLVALALAAIVAIVANRSDEPTRALDRAQTSGTSTTTVAAPGATTTTTTPGTTTNTAPTGTTPGQTGTTTAPTGIPQGVIGYVSCSSGQSAVSGYHAIGGTRFWPETLAYGGGTVVSWAADLEEGADSEGRNHWETFDRLRNTDERTQSPAIMWWMLCTRPPDEESDAANSEAAQVVLDEIHRRVPSAVVYASAMFDYVPPNVCGIAGADGPARMRALVDELVAAGDVLRGPDMGSLRGDQTVDRCHGTEEGNMVLGQRLLDFFG